MFGFLRTWLFNLRENNWRFVSHPSTLIPLLCTVAQSLAMIEASSLHSLRWPACMWASIACDLFILCAFSALLVYYDRAAPPARSTSSPSACPLDCMAHTPTTRASRAIVRRLYHVLGHVVPWAIGLALSVMNAATPISLAKGLLCIYIVPVIHVLAADMARVAWALRAAPDYCSLRLRLLGLCALLVSMAVYLTAQEVPRLLANGGQSPRPKPATFGHHAVSFFRGKASGLADGTFVMSTIVEKLSNSPCMYVVVVVPASTHHLVTSEDEAGAVRAEVRRTYQLTEVGPGVTRLDVAARARPNKPCGGLRSARPCCAPPAFPTSARCSQLS
jgi:hypothetical protein